MPRIEVIGRTNLWLAKDPQDTEGHERCRYRWPYLIRGGLLASVEVEKQKHFLKQNSDERDPSTRLEDALKVNFKSVASSTLS